MCRCVVLKSVKMTKPTEMSLFDSCAQICFTCSFLQFFIAHEVLSNLKNE